MHAAFIVILGFVVFSLLAGTVVAVIEMQRAPLGVETNEGFYFAASPAGESGTRPWMTGTRRLFLWL
jgi:hypothetical protein